MSSENFTSPKPVKMPPLPPKPASFSMPPLPTARTAPSSSSGPAMPLPSPQMEPAAQPVQVTPPWETDAEDEEDAPLVDNSYHSSTPPAVVPDSASTLPHQGTKQTTGKKKSAKTAVAQNTPSQPPGRSLAIASMVLGIFATAYGGVPIVAVMMIPVSIVGLVLGIVAATKVSSGPGSGKGQAIAGIVLSALSLLITILVGIMLASLFYSTIEVFSTI